MTFNRWIEELVNEMIDYFHTYEIKIDTSYYEYTLNITFDCMEIGIPLEQIVEEFVYASSENDPEYYQIAINNIIFSYAEVFFENYVGEDDEY